jgi:hypothetical protein
MRNICTEAVRPYNRTDIGWTPFTQHGEGQFLARLRSAAEAASVAARKLEHDGWEY